MPSLDTIRRIAERNVQTLALRPSRGFLTAKTKARVVDGLRCEIEDGAWRLAADMPAKAGGDETAPGYSEVRYSVSIDSPAPAAKLAGLLELAELHSPYLDVFGRATPLRRAVRLNGREA